MLAAATEPLRAPFLGLLPPPCTELSSKSSPPTMHAACALPPLRPGDARLRDAMCRIRVCDELNIGRSHSGPPSAKISFSLDILTRTVAIKFGPTDTGGTS